MLTAHAHVLALLGDDARAEAVLAEAIAQCRALGDRWWIGVTLEIRGLLALRQRRYAEARQHYVESQAAAAAVQMREIAVQELILSAWAACRDGDAAGAREALAEALRECRALGFTLGAILAVEAVAAVAVRAGQPVCAARLLGCAAVLAGGREHSQLAFRELRRETEAEVRTVLGDRRYADAGTAGRAHSREQALALAEAVAAGAVPPDTDMDVPDAL
jgi:hypothetical protein